MVNINQSEREREGERARKVRLQNGGNERMKSAMEGNGFLETTKKFAHKHKKIVKSTQKHEKNSDYFSGVSLDRRGS